MSNAIPDELFELTVVTDNPLFEGFALAEAPSLLGHHSLDDDITPGFDVADARNDWEQVRLRNAWQPPRVLGRVAPYNDYPGIDMVLPAFSRRACDVLHQFLVPNGELLPLRTESDQEYFFFNITTIVDALDIKNSDCDFWCDPPTTATSIEHFEFATNKLKGLSIFRIHQWPMGAIVTDKFVQRVREYGLNGFDFIKLWPFDRGVDWRKVGRRVTPKLTSDDDLRAHTIVLILPLKGKNPNREEDLKIRTFENELDSQLAISSLDSSFFGRYEGSDTINSEIRMFVSCPSANRLEAKLRPWLMHLNWRGSPLLVKRYGTMHDDAAEEETVEL